MRKTIMPSLIKGVAAAVLLVVAGCAQRTGLQEYKQTRTYFDTFVTIQCFYAADTDIDRTMEKCWQKLEGVNKTMNAESPLGYVSRINEFGFYGVQVSEDVYTILKEAVAFSERTGGAFDVTVYPLVRLWRTAAEAGSLPEEAALLHAKNVVGYRHILFEEDRTIRLESEGAKIALGAIAKGFAIDAVGSVLEAAGIEHYLIDAGGDIRVRGKNRGKTRWNIGIRDPRKKDHVMTVLQLTDCAVTTSGDYERFYTIDGKRYSHIINPLTGYPQERVISATVIAPTAIAADAYATAVMVLGAEKGLELIDSLDNVEALIIEQTPDQTLTSHSQNFPTHKK